MPIAIHGTSRPVLLLLVSTCLPTHEDKAGLVEVVQLWANAIEDLGSLPEGIVELRDALQDDRQDTTEP